MRALIPLRDMPRNPKVEGHTVGADTANRTQVPCLPSMCLATRRYRLMEYSCKEFVRPLRAISTRRMCHPGFHDLCVVRDALVALTIRIT